MTRTIRSPQLAGGDEYVAAEREGAKGQRAEMEDHTKQVSQVVEILERNVSDQRWARMFQAGFGLKSSGRNRPEEFRPESA